MFKTWDTERRDFYLTGRGLQVHVHCYYFTLGSTERFRVLALALFFLIIFVVVSS